MMEYRREASRDAHLDAFATMCGRCNVCDTCAHARSGELYALVMRRMTEEDWNLFRVWAPMIAYGCDKAGALEGVDREASKKMVGRVMMLIYDECECERRRRMGVNCGW